MTSLGSLLRVLQPTYASRSEPYTANTGPLVHRLFTVFIATFDLGFTAFGGPPVHFQIIHRRFVEGISTRFRIKIREPQGHTDSPENTHVNEQLKWVDPQTYRELFAICQALPGPGSTKMLTAIAGLHAGWAAGVFAFLVWSLPGAVGMFGLALGVQHVEEVLPSAVYALLSGLNSSTVGIVALSAVQLADKAIVDKLTRILVLFGACAGLCYNALWYFPALIVCGGAAAGVWDTWLRQRIYKARARRQKKKEREQQRETCEQVETGRGGMDLHPVAQAGSEGLQQRPQAADSSTRHEARAPDISQNTRAPVPSSSHEEATTDMSAHSISIPAGIALIAFTLALLLALLLCRTLLPSPLPRPLALFANMYLAGTIIFGGGPVVIPLLREYVVHPGWVTSRDFLIGLAIIQAFPGPNFNFGVFLGALALRGTPFPAILGAVLGYLGIFFPGIALTFGVQGFWRVLRTKAVVVSVLRGINATAVGLVFTAVYRLWGIGYLTPEASQGKSLALEPWWVVVAAVSYAETAWFDVPAAVAIVGGAVLGLAWYGAVGR